MARGAGNLDRRIVFERASATQNEFNEDVQIWTEYTSAWAERKDAADRARLEMMAAGQVGSVLTSRFVIRANPTTKAITAADRINYDGAIWSIFGIKETAEGRNRFLEVTASKDAD